MKQVKRILTLSIVLFIASLCVLLCTYHGNGVFYVEAETVSLSAIPEWNGRPSVEINGNRPSFSEEQKKSINPYVKYSKQDSLRRPRTAMGCLGPETVNHEDRTPISSVKPVGWHTKKYVDIVEDRYVYNRCHLLMQAAAGGIKSKECNSYKNLLTGTRYLNTDGMLPYETAVLDYIENTGKHVIYRVTPVYQGNEKIARGVEMEAFSTEDNGAGVSFHVFCYNLQPGIEVNYSSGKTSVKDDPTEEMVLALKNGATSVKQVERSLEYQPIESQEDRSGPSVDRSSSSGGASGSLNDNSSAEDAADYVLNTNTHRFHYPTCRSVRQMKDKNKWTGHFSRSELMENGYKPCGNCKP